MNKILFVCSANRDRSRTAEFIFQQANPTKMYRSVGINKYLTRKAGGSHITQDHIEWADKIICMELVHMEYIMQNFGSKNREKIVVLHLGDSDGGFMSQEMIELLNKKVKQNCSFIL